ncbi:UNVERIFIED_ORG: hypothetical protein ABIC72_000160 [Burkholderia sp. 1988]|uniref:Uncharacterized protein n=1 Tax=Paraburkholderia terricola TaxID=169427 RepID=A0ABU1LJ86_9BURK|nr:hypothetical protein [Paraburkholderia terricola]MDR6479549.1 hypothetical protein [Paraburkholderia terricola]
MGAILTRLMSNHSEFVEAEPHRLRWLERPFARRDRQDFPLRVFECDEQVFPSTARRPAKSHQCLCADLEDLRAIVAAHPECDGCAFGDTRPESFIDIDRHSVLPLHAWMVRITSRQFFGMLENRHSR